MFEDRVEDLKNLAEAMKEDPRFGICLDYAQNQLYGKDKKDWIKELAPSISHCHINDNDLYDDRHWEIGTGKLDWNVFTQKMEENGISPSVLIEVKDLNAWQTSMTFLKESGIYPY